MCPTADDQNQNEITTTTVRARYNIVGTYIVQSCGHVLWTARTFKYCWTLTCLVHEHMNRMFPIRVGVTRCWADWLRYKHDITIKSTLQMRSATMSGRLLASTWKFIRENWTSSANDWAAQLHAYWLYQYSTIARRDCIESRAVQMKSIQANWQTVRLTKVTWDRRRRWPACESEWKSCTDSCTEYDLLSSDDFHTNSMLVVYPPLAGITFKIILVINRSKNERTRTTAKTHSFAKKELEPISLLLLFFHPKCRFHLTGTHNMCVPMLLHSNWLDKWCLRVCVCFCLPVRSYTNSIGPSSTYISSPVSYSYANIMIIAEPFSFVCIY